MARVPSGTKADLAPQHRMSGCRCHVCLRCLHPCLRPLGHVTASMPCHATAMRSCLCHRPRSPAMSRHPCHVTLPRCSPRRSGQPRPTAPDGRAAHVDVTCRCHAKEFKTVRMPPNGSPIDFRLPCEVSASSLPSHPLDRWLPSFIPMPTVAFAIVRLTGLTMSR